MLKSDDYKLLHGDCLEIMKNESFKDIELIAVDLPYGVTNNRWDTVLDLKQMWETFEKIISVNGTVVLTATQPFATSLISSSKEYCKKLKFKYDLIWHKTIGSGQLNVRRQPMRHHEHILVFSKPKPIYNEQKTKGKPYKIHRKLKKYKASYGKQKDKVIKDNDGYRHAQSVITISNPRNRGGHPTQKPVELMNYIIKAYSKEGDIVLDCCMGAGTTGVSAILNERKFIGIELDEGYFNIAKSRIESAVGEWEEK